MAAAADPHRAQDRKQIEPYDDLRRGSPPSAARRELPPRGNQKALLAILLAWTAGVVDAVGYIVLSRVFTAHLSGDSAAFAVYSGSHDWIKALARGLPIPVFVLAVFIGAVFIEWAGGRGLRRRVGVLISAELVLLLGFLAAGAADPQLLRQGWGAGYFGLTGLIAAAMGLQTAALQRVGGRTVRTTYVTGMLTNLAGELATVALRPRSSRAAGHRARFFAALWSAFALGALIGGFVEPFWRIWTLLPAVAGLLVVIAVETARPLYPASKS